MVAGGRVNLLPSHSGFKLLPDAWILGQPIGSTPDELMLSASKILLQQNLAQGIEAVIFRCGLVGFGFSGWGPGQTGDIATIEENDKEYFDGGSAYRELARARLARAMVCNVFSTSLYTILSRSGKSPKSILILGPNDLLTLDSQRVQAWGKRALESGQAKRRIPLTRIQDALTHFDDILQRGSYELLQTLDLYARGLNALADHNYGLGLTLFWTVTEKLLFQTWSVYLSNHGTTVVANTTIPLTLGQRRKLLNPREATAWMVIKAAEAVGIIPMDVAADMHVAREAHNGWLHNLEPVTLQQSRSAGKLASRTIQHVESVDVDVKLSITLSL